MTRRRHETDPGRREQVGRLVRELVNEWLTSEDSLVPSQADEPSVRMPGERGDYSGILERLGWAQVVPAPEPKDASSCCPTHQEHISRVVSSILAQCDGCEDCREAARARRGGAEAEERVSDTSIRFSLLELD